MNYNRTIVFVFLCLLECFVVGMDTNRRSPSPQSKRFKTEHTLEHNTLVTEQKPETPQGLLRSCQLAPNFSLNIWKSGTDLSKAHAQALALAQTRVLREKKRMRQEREAQEKKEQAQDLLLDFLNWRAKSLGVDIKVEAFPENYVTHKGSKLRKSIAS